jgi:carbon-monoxide dehydrogenase small subunit
MLMAKALLKRNLRPTLEEVKVGLDGNLCRCTGYTSIFEAVMAYGGK